MDRRIAAALVLCGCGSSFIASDDIANFDAGTFDATTFGDASSDVHATDVAPETTPFNGGGAFLCAGCVCDGTMNLCFHGGGGGGAPTAGDAGDEDADAGPFGDASACAMDSGPLQCRAIPVQCLPQPTCDCITQVIPCACAVDPSGNGFQLECPPNP